MGYSLASLRLKGLFMGFDPVGIAVAYVCLLFSLCVHEAAHGAMADRCGDPTARLLGRVTLNPLAHIDIIGTVVMPLLILTTGSHFLIGWAKPVPYNPRNLRNMRRDEVLVALAGPGANLLLMIASVFVLRILIMTAGVAVLQNVVGQFAILMVMINLLLMLFNLIPIPPLDGSRVLHYFLPPAGQAVLDRVGIFGIFLVLILFRSVLGGPFSMLRDFVFGLAFLGL